jgi:hypothetical protein
MEKNKDDALNIEKQITFFKKIFHFLSFIYNIIWAVAFGILIYRQKENKLPCEGTVGWAITCFSICLLCPLKIKTLSFIEDVCEINSSYIRLVGLISSGALSIIIVVGLVTKHDETTDDNCRTFRSYQSIFLICESIVLTLICGSLSYLLRLKCQDKFEDGDGIISVKTLD